MLWLVLSVLWSIGWTLFVLWRSIVDRLTPVDTDYFAVPAVVMAPWLISFAVVTYKWVAKGFERDK